jgi:hypothetical protein
MRLELGTSVRCSDDVFGELADVVIDPITKRVTHLVVQPHEGHSLARLVPIELAEDAENGKQEISLRCTVEDVRRLEHVQEFAYLRLGESPASDPDWDVGIEDVLALPYYGCDGGRALPRNGRRVCGRGRSHHPLRPQTRAPLGDT